MAINQITLAQLTNEVMSIATQMTAMFNRIALYAADVVAIGTTSLQAAPYSLSSADATLLFNAAQDLDNFRKVYAGLTYVAPGGTVNTGVPTANDATHFGYPFNLNPGKCAGLGY